MSKTAFIFPGQGVQKAGMGKDFYENSEVARYIYDTATEALQLDMRKLCFEENAKLDSTGSACSYLSCDGEGVGKQRNQTGCDRGIKSW